MFVSIRSLTPAGTRSGSNHKGKKTKQNHMLGCKHTDKQNNKNDAEQKSTKVGNIYG